MSSGTAAATRDEVPDDVYAEEWRPFEADPGPLVFLMGCQRSGTTWLHLQLARTGAFRFLSAYDVYASDRLVHNHRHGAAEAERRAFAGKLSAAPADRGIDSIPAGPDTPEEYGLVISPPGVRYGRPDTTPETLDALRRLCAKKALLEGCRLPLLLKSPPDYPGAIGLLSAAWPGARFVAIQRHPLATLASQVRAWRQLLASENAYLALLDRGYRGLLADAGVRIRYGLFLHSPAGIGWLADCILRAHREFLSICPAMQTTQWLTLRYEDLCANQAGEFARLEAFLGMELPAPAAAPAPRSGTVPDEVRRAFEERREAFGGYLERYGYGAEAL